MTTTHASSVSSTLSLTNDDDYGERDGRGRGHDGNCNDDADGDDDATVLVWKITWTLAFPKLAVIPNSLFLTDDDNSDRDNGNISNTNILMWQKLALTVLWKDYNENNNNHKDNNTNETTCDCESKYNKSYNNNNNNITSKMTTSHTHQQTICCLPTRIEKEKQEDDTCQKEKTEAIFVETLSYKTDTVSSSSSSSWKNSLTYGEITEDTVLYIMDFLYQNGHLDHDHDDCPYIVDLGSGTGKVLLAASIGCRHPYCKLLGIEIIPQLHYEALRNYDHYREFDCCSIKNHAFEFVCTDFTTYSKWIQYGTIIFIHATLFEDDLMKQLIVLCQQCQKNTLFIVVSKKLNDETIIGETLTTTTRIMIDTIAELQLPMSWGYGTIYIQQKKT